MNGFVLVLVTAALGVDYGWQPSSDGRLEYIVQLEPVTLIALREGQEVLSQIDPYVKDIRRFRIRVGTAMVPRVGSPDSARQFGAAAPWNPPAGVTYGWQPVDAQSLEFILQLSPERIVLLKNGEEIVGEIPAEVGNVSRFRIRSASDLLPRQGLAGLSGAASYVAPANANQPPANSNSNGPTGQVTEGAPAVQPPEVTGNASPGSGYSASPSAAAEGASSSPSLVVPPPMGPTTTGPPRMTQSGATNTLPATRPVLQGDGARTQPSQVSPGGYQDGNRQAQGTPTLPQRDPRSFYTPPTDQAVTPGYTPAPGQAAGSGYKSTGSDPAPMQGNSWQQPPSAQQEESGGWSRPTENFQNWPPPDRTVQGTGQASTGAYSGWDPRSAPSNSYSGTQYNGAPPPLQSTDASPRPASPTYAPYATNGPPTGSNAGSFAGTNGGFSPYSQPSLPVSPTAAEYGANTGLSRPEPGSDMVSIVSLSRKPRRQAGPMDFWASLAETASDPDLAYLRDDGTSADAEKAWWPLTLAMLALFASMGGNLYMGWIAVDVYRRYLDAASDEYDDDDAASDRDHEREEDWHRDRRRGREPVTGSGRAVA